MFRRFRDGRIDEHTRRQRRETRLDAADFILPVFCVPGNGRREPVVSMPGVERMSADAAFEWIESLVARGLRAILVFGVPDTKGVEQAWDENGIVQKFVMHAKKKFSGLEVITDVCLCSYTHDGHCHTGDNDRTCELLARVALSHARAGADTVAPSAMMDGQVWFIRRSLDTGGFGSVRIMSYAAKFASGYYGPFRDAAACAPREGDRKGYQMDPANGDEALEEIAADIEQGADSIIVKPALAYLDIISRASRTVSCPVIAYNVSGEYSLLKKGISEGLVGGEIITETLISIKRAGASRIISYFAPELLPETSAQEQA